MRSVRGDTGSTVSRTRPETRTGPYPRRHPRNVAWIYGVEARRVGVKEDGRVVVEWFGITAPTLHD